MKASCFLEEIVLTYMNIYYNLVQTDQLAEVKILQPIYDDM